MKPEKNTVDKPIKNNFYGLIIYHYLVFNSTVITVPLGLL